MRQSRLWTIRGIARKIPRPAGLTGGARFVVRRFAVNARWRRGTRLRIRRFRTNEITFNQEASWQSM